MARESSEHALAEAAALRAGIEMEYAAAAYKSADSERAIFAAMQERLQAELQVRVACEERIAAERLAVVAVQDAENAERKRTLAARAAFQVTCTRMQAELGEAAASAELADAEAAVTETSAARERAAVMALQAAQDRIAAEEQLARVENERRLRDEKIAAELREHAALLQLQVASLAAPVAVAEMVHESSVNDEAVMHCHCVYPPLRRGWLSLLRPLGATGVAVVCVLAVITVWISLQAPSLAESRLQPAVALTAVVDADNVPLLKSSAALASPETFDANGALARR